ncbi:DUF4381 domain-containing protein [Tahibacter amnicola]|uniref:DUF4381 domain-containing protein n=1 Tax=Tahibacter amnicola TaxID=2976241 RepID=A0ABY6BI28_9GAMM|nr:DUF4381 domain-containing protein [Tahibacter amnicola]UXI68998.1 DUF4381 domain-containing protein [Tahibacter amnicola]
MPQLRDIHVAAAPGWWPPAPGWWILAVLVLAGLAMLLIQWRRQRRRARRARRLREALGQVRRQFQGSADRAAYAAALSQFLRRLALRIRPAAAVLQGQDWITFLDRHGDGFSRIADTLLDAPYRPATDLDVEALYDTVDRHLTSVLARELRDV